MTKEVIEKYIQFAIDNGFNRFGIFEKIYYNNYTYLSCRFQNILDKYTTIRHSINIEKLITSKEFIEAVTRGLMKKSWDGNKVDELIILGKENILNNIQTTSLYESITRIQAIAIRDGKLEQFILELIK